MFVLTVTAAACSDSEADRIRATSIPTYDPLTGKLTRLTGDINKNGKIDVYTYMDGTKVLRSEIDANEDGRIEKWEYHGDDGKVVRVAVSREENGKPDTWMYPDAEGKLTRAEISSEQDKSKIDRWEWYENEQLVRAEEDASGDGKVDKWMTYGADAVVRTVELDEDYDGRPDRRLSYGASGLSSIESEPDGSGGYRKRVEPGK